MRELLENLPEGDRGLAAKFARMRRLVERGQRSGALRRLVSRLVSGVPDGYPLLEQRAVEGWLRDRMRYTRDPRGVELFQDAAVTLELGGGDCDDLAILGAALLENLGHRTRFVAGGNPGAWRHVWIEAADWKGGDWRPIDPVAKIAGMPPGTDPRRIFPATATEASRVISSTRYNGGGGGRPPGGPVRARPSIDVQLRRAGVRYAPGVSPAPSASRSRLGCFGCPGGCAMGHCRLGSFGGYGGAGALDGFFSRIARKAKRIVRKVKPYVAAAAPLIPGVGPLVAGAISSPLLSRSGREAMLQQAVTGTLGRGAWQVGRGLYEAARGRGGLPGGLPGLAPPSILTPGIAGGTPVPYRPNYQDPGRRMQPWQGRMVDTCENWGIWTWTDDIAAASMQGRPIVGPDGAILRNKREWDAHRAALVAAAPGATPRERHYNVVRGNWCPPVQPGSPQARAAAGPTPAPAAAGASGQRSVTVSASPPPGTAAAAPAPASSGVPGWVWPAAAVAGVLLLRRR